MPVNVEWKGKGEEYRQADWFLGLPNPSLWRLEMSGETLHHEIRVRRESVMEECRKT